MAAEDPRPTSLDQTPEANWLVMEVHLTQGMLLPVDVNPPDVAQLLESGLIEAVKPNAKSRAT